MNTLTGQSGTLVHGYDYTYLFQQGPDNFVDEIAADKGTLIYRSQDTIGRAVMYEDTSENYRALHSTFIFSALQDGANTKQELMQIYLDYLLGN